MTALLPEILQPTVVNETVSRLKVINTRLQNFFNTGAPNPIGGRLFHWDIMDETREVATGRAPATGPGRINPQPVGAVNGVFPRVHESLPLTYEEVHNRRVLGGLATDKRGEQYIAGQQRILKQRLANYKEMQYLAMIRGGYFYSRDGDDVNISLTAGNQFVDFQIPAGNKNQLDMLGTGNLISAAWSVAATDIPLDLANINAAFEQLSGRSLDNIWLNSTTMNNVLTNDAMKALSGTANVVFDRYERVDKNDFIVVMKGVPWITWHITDGVLNFTGTVEKLFAADQVLFCPDPDPSWIQMYEGSEIVIEYDGDPPTEQAGEYYYATPTRDPAGYTITSLYNGIPALKNPVNIANADVQ